MKRNTHVTGSIIFAIIGTIIIKVLLLGSIPDNILNLVKLFLNMRVDIFLIMIGFSILGGIIPDILDPPFTKRHRRYAHSKILLLILVIFLIITLILLILNSSNLIMWSTYYFLIGYISHLSLDSLTPAGLWG